MTERRHLPDGEATHPRRLRRLPVWLGLACLVITGSVAFGVFRGRAPEQTPRDLAAEAEADLASRNFRPLSGPLEALLSDPAYKSVPTQAHPLLGRQAPDFTLADHNGKAVGLAEKLRNGPVVLVFYYGYHCNHCVSQLFALHKDITKFCEVGAEVVAVSADPADLTLERFKSYGTFAFPVLADPGNAVAVKYGTFTPGAKDGDEGELLHGTFVIDRRGLVVWANRGPEPFTENRTLLREARAVNRMQPTVP